MPPARFSSTAVSWYLVEGGVRQQPQVAIQSDRFLPQLDYSLGWAGRGVTLSDLKRYEEAIESFDKAIQVDTGWGTTSPAETWNNRGDALIDLQRYSDAIESHDKAITLKPDLYEAWSDRRN